MPTLRTVCLLSCWLVLSACTGKVPGEAPTGRDAPPADLSDAGVPPVTEIPADCVPVAGGQQCSCPSGYALNGTSCTPDCANAGLVCGALGRCDVQDGQALCRCAPNAAGPTCDGCTAGFHLDDGACVEDVTCQPNSCSGRGTCTAVGDGLRCACDEGYTGSRCESFASDAFSRKPIVRGMADPDVLKVSDDLYFLSGTQSGVSLALYESTDLLTFKHKRTYVPGDKDTANTYCDVWAPELTQRDGKFYVYFSSRRIPRGRACNNTPGYEVTTFFAVANDVALDFGPPQSLNAGTSFPRTYPAAGCPPEGCDRVIRIDSSLYDDGMGAPWLFYVWFTAGNNISAFRLDTPGALRGITGPALNPGQLAPEEEGINEGPDLFSRNGRQYLFFSGANFTSQYAMFYLMGDSVPALTRARVVRRNSVAVRNTAGRLVESHGHNSVATRKGEYFNFFHQGEFDAAGNLTGRSTWRQRMTFRPNGDIESLNVVDVRWSRVPGASYSLDVVKRDGTVVGPCVSAAVLGTATNAWAFNGICPSGGNALVHKGDVKAFRLYYSTDGSFTTFAEVPYDGHSDDVFVELPGGTSPLVSVRWNEKETGATYSLDVQRRSTGAWVAPCVASVVLRRSLSRTFDGRCVSAGNLDVPPSDIQRIRVCSALNENWTQAKCGDVPYDGKAMHVDVAIP